MVGGVVVRGQQQQWLEVKPGIFRKALHDDPRPGSVLLFRLSPGTTYPEHGHPAARTLRAGGSITVDETPWTGRLLRTPPGERHFNQATSEPPSCDTPRGGLIELAARARCAFRRRIFRERFRRWACPPRHQLSVAVRLLDLPIPVRQLGQVEWSWPHRRPSPMAPDAFHRAATHVADGEDTARSSPAVGDVCGPPGPVPGA